MQLPSDIITDAIAITAAILKWARQSLADGKITVPELLSIISTIALILKLPALLIHDDTSHNNDTDRRT